MSETTSKSTSNILRVFEIAIKEVIRRKLFVLITCEVRLDNSLAGEAQCLQLNR